MFLHSFCNCTIQDMDLIDMSVYLCHTEVHFLCLRFLFLFFLDNKCHEHIPNMCCVNVVFLFKTKLQCTYRNSQGRQRTLFYYITKGPIVLRLNKITFTKTTLHKLIGNWMNKLENNESPRHNHRRYGFNPQFLPLILIRLFGNIIHYSVWNSLRKITVSAGRVLQCECRILKRWRHSTPSGCASTVDSWIKYFFEKGIWKKSVFDK